MDATTLGKVQDIPDEHDNEVSALVVRLIATCCQPSYTETDTFRQEPRLYKINDSLTDDSYLVHQFEEQASEIAQKSCH